MNRKHEKKQMPLFYINQPRIKLPELQMQERFVFKNEEVDTHEQEKEERLERIDSSERKEMKVADSSEEKKKIVFNDLPLDEKIKHLKRVPASIAKVRYEFITIEGSFKGYFLDMKDSTLFIHSTSPRKKSASILLEDLVDVKRIGL